MEIVAFLVFIAVVIGAGGLVYAISVIGVQGETFEEAVEKQRKEKNEKKKEKKPAVEKKKKQKKNKDAKTTAGQDYEEVVLVDPSGDLVEPVFVEPTPAPVVKKEEPKPRKEEKKSKKKVAAEIEKLVEPEPVVEEVVAVAVAAPVVEAVVKAPAVVAVETAPVQKSLAKPEKKKIEIVEVAEVKVDDTEEKKKKKDTKAKDTKVAKDKPKKTQKSHYDEILSVIRKSPLSSTEAQGIVDVLLLKQTGKDEEGGDDWIEPGKENETKKLTRQIAELTEVLEEEKVKSAGIEKKMAILRKEQVEGRALAAGHKREVEELNNKKNNEISALNTRLQQATSQVNNAQTLNRQLESNQSHYQATINNLQTQLSQVAGGSDPKLTAELEQLKAARTEMVKTNSSLTAQLAGKVEEVQQLTAAQTKLSSQLTAAVEETSQANATLKQLKDQMEAQAAGSQQQLDTQLSTKQQFDSQLSAVTAAKQQLQLELTVLKEKLSGKEVENSRLLEENERLSEQVASSVERPAADGEEAVKVNGHQEVEVKPQEPSRDDMLEEKYKNLQITLKQIESNQKGVEVELESSKAEILKLRTKNDEEVGRLADYKQTCTAVFTRLFPAITAGELGEMETQAKLIIQNLEKSIAESQVVDQSEEINKLESQVSNYKNVLAQTEDMLTSLQESVEKAEGEWKKKLDSVESEGKSALENLKSKNTELQAQLEPLNIKIKEEVESKEVLAKKCVELQQLLAAGQKQISNHTNEGEILSNGSIEA